MTKVLITRDDVVNGSGVVIWGKGTKQSDLHFNGVWDAAANTCEPDSLIEIPAASFKAVFGWVPKSGTAGYYYLRKERKNRTPAQRMQYYINQIVELQLAEFLRSPCG